MFAFVKGMYDRGQMSAAQVWAAVGKGIISEKEAVRICGPKRGDV